MGLGPSNLRFFRGGVWILRVFQVFVFLGMLFFGMLFFCFPPRLGLFIEIFDALRTLGENHPPEKKWRNEKSSGTFFPEAGGPSCMITFSTHLIFII